MTMPALISLAPIALCVIWQARKKMKPTASDHQGKVRAYVFGLLYPLAVVVGQGYVAYELLVRGGALPG
ncbi:hypothetical protein N2K95_01975 [Arthrobacter zhaoxinii]|uniref:Uncharacterized protein n=1 Tax=Arthrobacter zhaoxinii TaxID=2964616 RepID=A0ABY5YTD7_9MICC|nr:hypothetical protein [Arthrobacter zhaoxinii]UWX97486.1 hypothetical protein N2K95_01975 [Arthrobacter zhaoxinii]